MNPTNHTLKTEFSSSPDNFEDFPPGLFYGQFYVQDFVHDLLLKYTILVYIHSTTYIVLWHELYNAR